MTNELMTPGPMPAGSPNTGSQALRAPPATWPQRLVACALTLFLAFVCIGTRPYQNELLADSAGTTDNLRQLVVFALAALGIGVFAVTARTLSRDAWLALGVVLLYSGFLIASLFWSDQPSFVIRRAGTFLLVGFALFVLAEYLYSANLLLTSISAALLGVLIINVLSMLLLYGVSIDHEGMWKGIQIHKNVAGAFSAICAIHFFWHGLARHRAWWLAAAAAIAFLPMTGSKTSLALFMGTLGIMALAVVIRKINEVIGAWATLASLACLLAGFIVFSAATSINTLVEYFYGDPTFTGRVFIWDYVLAKHAERPWLGFGFGSFWGMGPETPAIREAIPLVQHFGQAHNGYLDILVQTGWLGMAVFFALLALALYPALKSVFTAGAAASALSPAIARRHWLHSAQSLNLIVFVMLHNLLESTWLVALSTEWTMLFLCTVFLFLNHRRDVKIMSVKHQG